MPLISLNSLKEPNVRSTRLMKIDAPMLRHSNMTDMTETQKIKGKEILCEVNIKNKTRKIVLKALAGFFTGLGMVLSVSFLCTLILLNKFTKFFDIHKLQSPERRKAYVVARKELNRFIKELARFKENPTAAQLASILKKNSPNTEVYIVPADVIREYTGVDIAAVFVKPYSEEEKRHLAKLYNSLTEAEKEKYRDFLNFLDKQSQIEKKIGWDGHKSFIMIPSDTKDIRGVLGVAIHEKCHELLRKSGTKSFDFTKFSTFKEFYDYQRLVFENISSFDKRAYSASVLEAIRENDLSEIEVCNAMIENRFTILRSFWRFFHKEKMYKSPIDWFYNFISYQVSSVYYGRLLSNKSYSSQAF